MPISNLESLTVTKLIKIPHTPVSPYPMDTPNSLLPQDLHTRGLPPPPQGWPLLHTRRRHRGPQAP